MIFLNPLTLAILCLRWTKSPIEKLIQNDAEAWMVSVNYIVHCPSSLHVWIANGPFFIKVKAGYNGEFWKPSLIERHAIWIAYNLYIKTLKMKSIKKLALRYLDRLEAPIK
jgi:hypothetical protein